MKLSLFAIKDNVAGEFKEVVTFPNVPLAMRAIKTAVNDVNKASIMAMYPEDTAVYKVGEYDTTTGDITSKVEFIAQCSALLEKRGDENA